MGSLELATIDTVKGKLGIALTDASHDADLTIALLAATRHVLAATRYALTPTVVTSELHENVLEGTDIYTALRPIDTTATFAARGRVIGSGSQESDWTSLLVDVIDPVNGRLRVIGTTFGFRVWPPPLSRPGYGQRNRTWRWPVLELAYTTLEPDGLEDLAEVAAAMAAFVYREGQRGAIVLETVGAVTEQSAAPVPGIVWPPYIEALLDPYLTPKARLTS